MNSLLDKCKKGSKKFISLLEWKVFLYDFNNMQPKEYNIFKNANLQKYLSKLYKDCQNDRDKFTQELNRLLLWLFCGRCEYEFIMSSWPPSEKDKKYKLDVYEQLMLNFDRLVEYLWGE
jgi:hypothetical protein